MLRTALIEDKHATVTSMKTAGKGYNDECHGKKPEEHKKGPPCIHIGWPLSDMAQEICHRKLGKGEDDDEEMEVKNKWVKKKPKEDDIET